MTHLRRLALLLPLLSVLMACEPAPDREPSGTSQPQGPEAPTDRVAIPASVRRNLGMTFARVEAREVAATLRVPGAFELKPLARREYRMALPGTVELLVDQYEPVEVGTPLFRFRSPAWPELLHEILLGDQAIASSRAEIVVGCARLEEAAEGLAIVEERIADLAQAEIKRAELNARAAELRASMPRLEAELALVETRLLNARRTYEHALHRAAAASGLSEAELSEPATGDGADERPGYLAIDWIEVRAEQAGVVEALEVTSGSFVESATVVLSTVDPSQLRFRALALQADLPRLTGVDRARIVPTPTPGLPPDDGLPAALALGLEADPQERTVALVAAPEGNADWARAGVSAFLEIVVASSEGLTLAVPESAIVRDGLEHVLFRRDPRDPDQAIRVQADLGVRDGVWVALRSGVARGDEVVLSGVYELKLATQQAGGAEPGGHFHADGSFHAEH